MLENLETNFFVGLLAFARIAAVVFTAPVLGDRAVQLRFRVLLALFITIAAMPLIDQATATKSLAGSDFVASLFSEAFVGALLGLGITIVFSAAQVAGTVIGQMAGIQIGETLSPGSAEPASPVSQMFGLLSLAAFALVGGPELVISATLDTFVAVPLGIPVDVAIVGSLLPDLLEQSFLLTLRAVAPAVAALMISTLAIGMISRSHPQMNLLGLGLNSNLIVMLLALFFTLGGSVWLFVDDLEHFVMTIQEAIAHPQAAPLANVDQELIPVTSHGPTFADSVPQAQAPPPQDWWAAHE